MKSYGVTTPNQQVRANQREKAACTGITRHDTNPPPSAAPPSAGFDSTQYLTDNPTRRNISFPRFGNLTTARGWTSGSTYIATHSAYDIAGNAVWAQDGRTKIATATYPSSNACAYPSQMTLPGTPSLTWELTWDLILGKMLTHKDPHDVVTQYGYESLLGRMNSRVAAAATSDANQTSVNYDDTSLIVTSLQDLEQAVPGLRRKESSKFYDGLGRLYEERQKTGGSDIVVRTEYDTLGRVLRRSIPAATPTNWETFEYDALDRVTKRSWGDGSHEDTQYQRSDIAIAAEQTKVIDAAGKWRILAGDGLGRIAQVREPLASGYQDTSYTYNALDGLLSVNQSGRLRTFGYDGLGRLLQAVNPESGTVSYFYDNNGNVTQRTDARNVVTTMGYDDLNRLVTKTYSGGAAPNVTNAYNLLRLTSTATTSGVTQAYTYTPGGRIATSTQTAGGVSYPFSYEYYLDGSQKSVTYPSGRKISYPDPDLAGRVTKVEGLLAGAPKSYVSSIGYNEHGLLASMALGTTNNLLERWSYSEKRLQPYDIRLGTAAVEDGAGRWEYSYCSGGLPGSDCATNNGNVMHQRIKPLNAIQNYAYDPMNRLSLVEETAGFSAPACAGAGSTPCRAFGYDDWGNMYVSYSRVVTTNSFTPVSASWFDLNNRLKNDLLLPEGVKHDPAGNQTAIGGYTSSYDGENRLATSTLNSVTTTYTYDGEGRRVTKATSGTGGVTTTFVYDAAGRLAAEYGGTPPTAGGTSFLTADHLGSTRLVVKSDGTPDRRIDYLPFGEFIPAGVGGRTTGLGYESSEVLAAVNRRFTGKERDEETGLDYFGARYFSGTQGRFSSPDQPFADQFVEDPQSWNLYAYTRNNPLRYIDDDGRGAKEFLYGMFNATSTNAVGGIGRARATHPHERLGQRVGDVISFGGGLVEMAFGGSLAGGGGGACATGVGCLVGAPTLAAGVAVGSHGAVMSGTALVNLMQASDDAPGSSGSSEPLVGSNPREAKGRTNTNLSGGHKAATDKFGELSKGQKVVVDPKRGHRVAADGTRLRLNPDGTARVDIPKSTNRPKHETVHFSDPDKLKQP